MRLRPAMPLRLRPPMDSDRVQARARRFRRLGATQRPPTKRPGCLGRAKATVTRATSDSPKLIVVPTGVTRLIRGSAEPSRKRLGATRAEETTGPATSAAAFPPLRRIVNVFAELRPVLPAASACSALAVYVPSASVGLPIDQPPLEAAAERG